MLPTTQMSVAESAEMALFEDGVSAGSGRVTVLQAVPFQWYAAAGAEHPGEQDGQLLHACYSR
ncbi:MAG TPA: hypothetical protein VEF89_10670 [Solirubrobacteraceae bacterium]|nr:hypothetical protein [Solirubrobacteraceae bacterium]